MMKGDLDAARSTSPKPASAAPPARARKRSSERAPSLLNALRPQDDLRYRALQSVADATGEETKSV